MARRFGSVPWSSKAGGSGTGKSRALTGGKCPGVRITQFVGCLSPSNPELAQGAVIPAQQNPWNPSWFPFQRLLFQIILHAFPKYPVAGAFGGIGVKARDREVFPQHQPGGKVSNNGQKHP